MASGWRWGNFPIPGAHVLSIAMGALLDAFWPLDLVLGGWAALVGVLSIVVAACLTTWATVAAGRVNLASPDRIVATGPYRASRHPMYVGWTLLYLGLIPILSSGWLIILFPLLAVWVHFESVKEEKRMLESFGPSYEEYQARVPRYLSLPRKRTQRPPDK